MIIETGIVSTVHGFLEKEELNSLNILIDSLELNSSKILPSYGPEYLDTKYRSSKNYGYAIEEKTPKFFIDIVDKLLKTVKEINENNYHLDIGEYPLNDYEKNSVMLVEYSNVGDYFNYHQDWGQNPKINTRKLSCSIQLTHPEQYEGCELEIKYDENKTHIASKQAGDLIVFSSFFLHRVTPLISGKRRSIVAWFKGSPVFSLWKVPECGGPAG